MNPAKSELATVGAPHVRDAIDVRAVTRAWLLALAPCVAFGLYNTGYQANRALAGEELASGAGWRTRLLEGFGAGRDPASVVDCTLLGALHFVPLLLVALAVGAICERVFARGRRRELSPGIALTAALFTACLPATVPLWQAALGIAFAVVVGQEIFGGAGRNVFHPAVVGLAFLTFAYPATMRDPEALAGLAGLAGRDAAWGEALLGRVPGALAWTSKLGCALGALVLLVRGVASWRTMLGVLGGAAAVAWFLPGPGPVGHLLHGGLVFGAVFLATDLVTSPMTDVGRWLHGVLVGVVTVLIRDANPLHAEGILLAVLFGNVCAPLIDHGVIRVHVLRRRRRLART